jgi:hypothetical protein
MRFLLTHVGLPTSWKGPWIYIGRDYLRMRAWEQSLVGQRISLKEFIQTESIRQRPLILDWIRRQREANNDSIHWWMTDLAGRNNMSCRFFDDVIHISALKSWITTNASYPDEILVVCEDGYLLAAVKTNLESTVQLRCQIGWQITMAFETSYLILRACVNFARQILRFWKHHRAAQISRPFNLQPPQGEVYLIHQCLDDKAFNKEGPLACRYFTVLPEWLEKQGKQVYRLPWLFNVSLPLEEVYQKLRDSSCFIPEDWLTWCDYVRAFYDGIKTVSTIRKSIPYKDNFHLEFLLIRERFRQLTTGISVSRFLLYLPALRRWGNNLTKLVSITHFESMQPERVQPYFCRFVLGNKSKSIGYYHSLVASDYLGYHIPSGESESKFFPDIIVTNGGLGHSVLISRGLDEKKLLSGPALRQNFVQTATENSGNCLGIPLPLDVQGAVEMLDGIYAHFDWIRNYLKSSVILKPHPMMSRREINILLSHMGWTDLPQDWQWCEGEMTDLLKISRCCLVMSTASIIDVLLSGRVAISLGRELTSPWNCGDLLENEFPILRSVSPKNLCQRLEEVFLTDTRWYDHEFLKIRQKFLAGLNQTSDQTLSVFL